MAKSINDCTQNVLELFGSAKRSAFVVPEYQRPYAWAEDEVVALFADIMNFVKNDGGARDKNKTYFLGSIVSFVNDDGLQEIIDGQQRITSLFLLLRAIFDRLEHAESSSENAATFLSKIGPIIWESDPLSEKVDRKKPLILTKVVDDRHSAILTKILETGTVDKGAKDNYSRNYSKFVELYEEESKKDGLGIDNFIYAVLNQAVLLPIAAADQDAALRIFSTLNDRGHPLSDADIFKAKMYGILKSSNGDYQGFVRDWKDLQERCELAHETMQSLFYYYMFYVRAQNKDSDTSTPGARKYFLADKCARLKEPKVMEDLGRILALWEFANLGRKVDGEAWMSNPHVRNALDVLSSYPNEFWKYPVVIYYLAHSNGENFEKRYALFLRKLCSVLLSNYLDRPSVSAVKGAILKLNVEIISSAMPRFTFGTVALESIEERVKVPHSRIVRMILKMLAYGRQTDPLPLNWEIEHILPRRWEPLYFATKSPEEVYEKIEHIGNKIPLEKSLNIKASNGYFEEKRSKYAKSTIQLAKDVSKRVSSDWKTDHIVERDAEIVKALADLISKFESDYDHVDCVSLEDPTEEQKRQIEMFKQKGWI